MSAFPATAGASEFASAVRQRSWDWLTALQRRLNVDRLQIVDELGWPLAPEVTSPSSAVTLRAPEVTSAIAKATKSKTPESVRLGDLQVACVALTVGQGRGAMLLARTVSDTNAAKIRTELELIGSWLRPAIEAHLGSTQPDQIETQPRVSSLFKVLSAAASDGHESTLLRLYANALTIWHDIDLRAYVEDAEGNFRLEIALPGIQVSQAPTMLEGKSVSVGPELARVSSHDLELLGFHATEAAMAARVGTAKDGMSWLLVLSGGIDSAGEARLALYTDLLRQALQNVAAASLLSIERGVWRHLVGAANQMSAAAEAALQELRIALGARTAALLIAVPRSAQLVRVGDVSLLVDADHTPFDRLRTTVDIVDGGTLTLILQEPKGQFFTSRDRDIVESIGQMLGSWAGGLLQRAPAAFNRRAVSRPFEDILEQAAAQAAAQGGNASVVVIQMAPPALHPSQAHRMAGQIRAHLRAGEPVGVVGGGEIGLLLYDCTPDVARTVVKRLRHELGRLEDGRALAAAAVGISHCRPGSTTAARLVRAAREDAASHETAR